ncbi:hypothetical protein GCM10017691_48170 [Pseudonocardia petroleophila]|uniref:O-antigen ligase n=1 Tax=Pseudonocardia petroleophila TaxID=37331 RepID=A0A7G7MQE6_9PSEU|nr:hypothetical protein [Pseudonocardia petroleophila]QNG55007.1 hypothetical protein H6H00_14715 [Pseudonocardia petroleophila]
MSTPPLVPRGPSTVLGRRSVWAPAAVLLAALLAGLVGAFGGVVAVGAVGAVVLLAVTAFRPAAAVYVYMAALPFLSGIERDQLIPFVRPNEALLVLVLAGALAGGYGRLVRGGSSGVRQSALDVPLFVFVLLSTLWPVVSLLLRGLVPTGTELTALLPICKLAGLFLLVRLAVRTDRDLLRLARVVTWPAAVVALIAVLQTAGFPPVIDLLSTLWTGGGDPAYLTERGTTTFASSIATGDYVVLALALLTSLVVRDLIGSVERTVLGLLLAAGVLAAGQFSTWASAVVVAVVLLRENPALRRTVVRLLPLAAVALVVGLPAFVLRLSQFGDGFGVPRSWLGRWDNLVSFYLPRLLDGNVLLGISPDSVLPAPETWREVIYLEYGYLQLLWVGGLPLLAAFGWLSVVVLRESGEQSCRPDVTGAYASTLVAAWWMVLLLSVIDIHLVLRGTGELLFLFMAIISGRVDARTPS